MIKKNIQSLFRKKNIYSLIINSFLVVIILFLFCPHYDNPSDIIMQNLLYGSIPGLKTSHLFFSNVILGKGLSILLSWLPGIAWYTIVQYVVLFIALFCIGYIILERSEKSRTLGNIILISVLLFLGYEGYISPGYIRTACIVSCSGCLLLMHTLEKNKKLFCFGNIFAIFLIVIGTLYSFKAAIICILLSFIMALGYHILLKKYIVLTRSILLVFIIIITSCSLYYIDVNNYKNSYVWSDAYVYRNSYEKILSYGIDDDYEKNEFNEFRFETKEQYSSFVNDVFLNGNADTLEQIDLIASQSRQFSFNTISSYFKTVPIKLFSVDVFYLWLFLIIIFLLYSKKRRVIYILPLIIILVGMFVLYTSYSTTAEWGYCILFVPLSLQLLLYADSLKSIDSVPVVFFGVIYGIILYSTFSGTINTKIHFDEITEVFEDINSENIYLIDLDKYCSSFDAFTRYSEGMVPENVYIVNGFYSTMTYYSQFIYQNNTGIKENWLYNPEGYAVSELLNFETMPNEEY